MLSTKDQIIAIRAAIRYHRGQISDFRCWVDDLRLYEITGLADPQERTVPSTERFLQRCEAYWELRQRPAEIGRGSASLNSESAPLSIPQYSNQDLDQLSPHELAETLNSLIAVVSDHCAAGFLGRTHTDDEKLYAVLPEQTEWSSALPARHVFLTNCERFCAHCQKRPEDLLDWGVG